METTYLEFSANGTEVTIHFEGKESLSMYSKVEVFESLLQLITKKKILVSDFTRLRDEILAAKNLPYNEERSTIKMILVDVASISFFSLFDSFLESDHNSAPKENPVEAYFEICTCQASILATHGLIYFSTGYKTSPFVSKEKGMEYLNLAKAEHIKSEAEFEKVVKELEQAFSIKQSS